MMTRLLTFCVVLGVGAGVVEAADVYGTSVTAQSVAMSGISLAAAGATDALASNPSLLSGMDRPYLEFSALGVLAGGTFHNSTPFAGHLDSDAGVAGSLGFAMRVPGTRINIGAGAFPVSLLSDRWTYQDPAGTAGASYGVQSSKSAFVAVQSSVGAAMPITKWLTAGAALGVVENLNTLETPYIFQTNPTLAGLKTLLKLHTSGVGYNGTFGVTAQATRRLEVAAAYKTKTVVESTGTASGDAYAQFAALGLAGVPSAFRYRAEVDNVFPQSATLTLGWQAQARLRAYVQGDWLDWEHAFTELPVHLTGGDNARLNTLLKTTSLNDSVPLHWKDQWTGRAGIAMSISEFVSVQGGYSHSNAPVPGSTLSPLTAAIMTDGLSAGVGYERSRYRVQLGYQVNVPKTATVGTSSLLAGEYSDTRTHLWLQTLALTTGLRF